MSSNLIPTTLTPKMMVYLGPRMQAVHNLVMTEKIDAFKAAWPLAERALAIQDVEIGGLTFPTADEGIHPFAQSLLVRARPQFMKELKGVLFSSSVEHRGIGKEPKVKLVRRESEEASIIARREMITQGALYTFAMSGVLEESAVEAFKEVADSTYGKLQYESDLMKDLTWLDAYLTEPDVSDEALDKLYDVWARYVEPARPVPHDDVWPDVWADYVRPLMRELRETQEWIKHEDYRQKMLSRSRIAHRELGHTVISDMQRGIEVRLMHEVISDDSTPTVEDIQWVYNKGFISPLMRDRLMSLLKRLS